MRLALKIKQKRRFVGLEPAVIGRKNSSGWPHPETVRENHDLSLGERSSKMGWRIKKIISSFHFGSDLRGVLHTAQGLDF